MIEEDGLRDDFVSYLKKNKIDNSDPSKLTSKVIEDFIDSLKKSKTDNKQSNNEDEGPIM